MALSGLDAALWDALAVAAGLTLETLLGDKHNETVAKALVVKVQIGEKFNGKQDMIEALADRECDYVMPDVYSIGGVSG